MPISPPEQRLRSHRLRTPSTKLSRSAKMANEQDELPQLERISNHQAALTRNFPLGPTSDASHLERYDPMRLPDMHLRRADGATGAIGLGGGGFQRSIDTANSDVRQRDKKQPADASRQMVEDQVRETKKERHRTIKGAIRSEFVGVQTAPGFEYDSRYETLNHAHRQRKRNVEPSDYVPIYTPTPRQKKRNVEPSDYGTGDDTEDEIRAPSTEGIVPPRPSSPWKAPDPEYLVTASRQRFGLICETLSRDETCSEETRMASFVKTALEPRVRKAQVSEVSY